MDDAAYLSQVQDLLAGLVGDDVIVTAVRVAGNGCWTGSHSTPQCGELNPEEAYLVFYEGNLVWSVRPELPPVGWGAEIRRQHLEPRAQGRTDVGWYAHHPDVEGHPDNDAE